MNARSVIFWRGFTLSEIMILMAILGILAALSVPAYQNFIIQGKVAEAMALLDEARMAAIQAHSRYGSVNAKHITTAVAGASSACIKGCEAGVTDHNMRVYKTDATKTIYAKVRDQGHTIEIAVGLNNIGEIKHDADYLYLQGRYHDGSFQWLCGNPNSATNAIPEQYLPSYCTSGY